MSILCSIDDFILSKQDDKAVPFHDPLKRLKLKIYIEKGYRQDNFLAN